MESEVVNELPDDSIKRKSNPNAGHRERLRRRFREHGLDNFQDYEVVELLLLYVARQKDMKPVARHLIERFGFFQAILDAPEEELVSVDGLGDSGVTLIKLIKASAARYLKQSSEINITPQNITELIAYCRLKMGALPHEQFLLVSLNASFAIVSEDVIAEGTIDQAAVYPRKVVEMALKHGATTLIFVHNHPSGDTTPSEMDKAITRSLNLATRTVGVTVYDHIIVSRIGYFSFREQSLL
jgi:DNA repair protein RadC